MSQKSFERISGVLTVVAASLIAQTAWSADSLAQRIEACAQHQDDAARLQCFDREASALRAARPAAEAMPDRRAAEAVPDRRAVEPSRSAPVVSPLEKPQLEKPPADQPVTARVVSVSKPARALRIELDNGQVWQQNEHEGYLTLSAGDTVQIKSGALTSFLLRTPSGVTTHVHRVR